MAPKRKTASKARRIASKRLVNKRRSRRTRPGVTLPSLIVKGVNTLLSVLPGSSIFKPIADFVFKSVGFSTKITINGDTVFGTVNVFGSSAAFFIPLTTIIQDSPLVIRANQENNVAQKDILTTFTYGRLLQVRVLARPIGQLSQRQGQWALAYVPFTSTESEAFYVENISIPTLRDVLAIPGAVQAGGTQPLSINYRPRRNTFDAMAHPLTTSVGMVMICYEDLSRNKGSEFGPEDFGAEIVVSGTVHLSNPMPHAGWQQLQCKVNDCLKSYAIRVNQHVLSSATLEPSGDALSFTGTKTPSKGVSITADGNGGLKLSRDAPLRSPASTVAEQLAAASLET